MVLVRHSYNLCNFLDQLPSLIAFLPPPEAYGPVLHLLGPDVTLPDPGLPRSALVAEKLLRMKINYVISIGLNTGLL